MAGAILECDRIDKGFSGVAVLRAVSLALRPGRILGLVGENGAGKSTLTNILGGVLAPDAGSMTLAGSPYAPTNPSEAARRGVAFIHQELNLFPNLSIAENLFLPAFPRRSPWLPVIDRRATRARTRGLLAEVGLDRAPDTPVERLSPGERQLVEIARALTIDARVMIFDEPTTSLSAQDAARLLALIEALKSRGIAILYISHDLGDVLRLCDDVAILRDGAIVGAGPTEEFPAGRLIALMVGRGLGALFPDRISSPSDRAILEVDGLSRSGVVAGIGFALHAGEVLGVGGLMGSGRTELARILFGLDPHDRGAITLDGEPLGRASTRERIARGMAYLTEDRREEGLLLGASVSENVVLAALPSFASGRAWFVDRRRADAAAEEVGRSVQLRAASPRQPVRLLSGGNQQKVVLARWLLTRPKVLILDEPTRGVDVGAKQEIYRLIDGLASRGAGVLLISSEIEELIGLCDRILVMDRGEIRATFPRRAFDREAILRAALGEGPES